MIYLLQDGQQTGPYDIGTLLQMRRSGSISNADLAWEEGMEDWCPLGDLLGAYVHEEKKTAPPPKPSAIKSLAAFSIKLVVAICIVTVGFPILIRTISALFRGASYVGSAVYPKPPAEMLNSKLHVMVDGRVVDATDKTLTDIVSRLEDRGSYLSWSESEDGSWIFSINRHDPLTDTENEARLEFMYREGKTIVMRGTANGNLMDERSLHFFIAAMSGAFENLQKTNH